MVDARCPALSFVPFLPEHLRRAELAGTRYAARLADPRVAASLPMPGLSWSGFAGDVLVGCAGIVPIWPGRAQAWAVLADVPRRCWPAVTAHVHLICAEAHRLGWARLETTVIDGFAAGQRWAEKCGFDAEGLMRGYGPDGTDHWLYARTPR